MALSSRSAGCRRCSRRGKQESDLVNIAQIFQRAGTLSVAWADSGITSPEDYAGKKVGVWDFGNELEVIASAQLAGLERDVDYEVVIQPFDMTLLLNAADGCEAGDTDCVDVAEAMIYNEYAQVLETENPETGELYQPEDLNVIDYNEVGTAMLQDALFARADMAGRGGQRGHRGALPARLSSAAGSTAATTPTNASSS